MVCDAHWDTVDDVAPFTIDSIVSRVVEYDDDGNLDITPLSRKVDVRASLSADFEVFRVNVESGILLLSIELFTGLAWRYKVSMFQMSLKKRGADRSNGRKQSWTSGKDKSFKE